MSRDEEIEFSTDTGLVSQLRLKAFWPSIFSIIVLLGLVCYLYLNAHRFQQLLDISIASLLLLCGLELLSIFTRGLINYLFYRHLGALIKLNEGVGLAVVNTVSNQLPFAGGLIAKAVYLKKRHKLAYTRYMSATVALYVCYVSSSGVGGIGVLIYRFFRGDGVPILLALGFSGMVASVFLFCLPVNINFLPDKWGQRIAKLADGWQLLTENQLVVGQFVGLQTVLTLLAAGRLWIAFHALSQNVTLSHCLLFSSASILTRLVSISPGGLGVREAIIASVASVLGFDVGISAVAVGIDRLVSTSVNIVLGAIYTYILSKKAAAVQLEPET